MSNAAATSTKATNPKAVREYNAAVTSLAAAEEQLSWMMATAPATPNFYIADTIRGAVELVREMEDNLDSVMDDWSPEECGL